jgi:outer membrane protein
MKSRCRVLGMMAAMILVAGLGRGTALAQEPAAPPAGGEKPGAVGCKVGFVNLARVLEESKEGQKLKQSLEAEREKAFAPLKAKQEELEQLEQQISALTQEIIQKSQVWDNYTKLSKQNELQNLQMKYNNNLQVLQLDKNKIQDDLNKKKDEMLKPLEDKLNTVMEEIGKQGGYCLVLDVSPPTPNMPSFNPVIYRDPALDITDQLIKAVDK